MPAALQDLKPVGSIETPGNLAYDLRAELENYQSQPIQLNQLRRRSR